MLCDGECVHASSMETDILIWQVEEHCHLSCELLVAIKVVLPMMHER